MWVGVPLAFRTFTAVLLLWAGDWTVAWALLSAVAGAFYAMAHPLLFRQYFEQDLRAKMRPELKRRGVDGIARPVTLTLTDQATVADSSYAGRSETRLADLMPVKAGEDRTVARLMTGDFVLIVPRRGCESQDVYERVRDFLVSRTEHNTPSDNHPDTF